MVVIIVEVNITSGPDAGTGSGDRAERNGRDTRRPILEFKHIGNDTMKPSRNQPADLPIEMKSSGLHIRTFECIDIAEPTMFILPQHVIRLDVTISRIVISTGTIIS